MTGFVSLDSTAYHADDISPGRGLPARERFLRRVLPDPNTGCWLWRGGHDSDGYAKFFEKKGASPRAQRYAYAEFVGPIPTGLVLDHLCRNRGCVNPAHLEPVTPAENARRAVHSKAARTHCPRGHEFTPENTYLWRPGQGRKCRKCHAITELARWRRQKGIAA